MEQIDIEAVVKKLHDTVLNGKLGLDYTFDHKRVKNRMLRRRYNVDDQKMISILLDLTGKQYIKSEKSKHKDHPEDIVHVFKTVKKLVPKYDEEHYCQTVCIYIKVTWPANNAGMFIISFHEDE